jgi:acyl-CoA thioesterase I
MRARLFLCCLSVALLALAQPASAAEPAPAPVATPLAPESCDAPAALLTPEEPLPHIGATLRAGGRVDVLAVGSASLLGPREGVAGSVPDRMVQQLHAAFPAADIHLTMRAERAEAAADMLAVLKRELAAHPYQLVLWQSGTVEALRKQPPEHFRATLGAGADLAANANADLVVIDLPFSRLLDKTADLEPYRTAFREIAARPGVVLFPRYDLMRSWSDAGELDLESSAKRERRRTADELRDCLGVALARMILAAPKPN